MSDEKKDEVLYSGPPRGGGGGRQNATTSKVSRASQGFRNILVLGLERIGTWCDNVFFDSVKFCKG